MNTAILALLLAQSPSLTDSRELDAKTKPYEPLAHFEQMAAVSVSEYRFRQKGVETPPITRVYRYTYQADFDAEAKKWEKMFTKADGWEATEKVPDFIMERQLKKKDVSFQALILHRGRIVPDRKVRARTRIVPEKGWVWVSFNEQMTRTKW
jgi:hypothetical protein